MLINTIWKKKWSNNTSKKKYLWNSTVWYILRFENMTFKVVDEKCDRSKNNDTNNIVSGVLIYFWNLFFYLSFSFFSCYNLCNSFNNFWHIAFPFNNYFNIIFFNHFNIIFFNRDCAISPIHFELYYFANLKKKQF